MANILSLAAKINTDASGFKLDPVQKALRALGEETDKVSSIFDKFTDTSEAAAKAQANTSKALNDLIEARRNGSVTAEEFAKNFERIRDAATQEASALERAARITEANITPLQRYKQATADLNDQVQAGRITQETFERAMAKAKAQLDGTAASASKTDSSMAALLKNVRLISAIEIGRAIIDGLQAIGNVISGALGRISSFVSSVANSFDQFNDLSARTGIGVEALQGYSLAAKLAGIDTAEFGSAVQKLAVSIGKATPGDNLDKSLKAINLSVTQLRGLAPEQQFSAIGEAISGLPTAADRAAAAVEIFGNQGAALAPLFREGAASIEELRDRAERLGIIVDETQLNNIGAMNDAFDLARATVEGIAGQVIGNLAPAVTAVVDQFLLFIEEFAGAEGSGGTGIANAISKVLFDGAEFLAGVFDSFVADFSGFSGSLQSAADVFAVVGNVLVGISEGLRTIFNVFEIAGNALIIGLGKVLEGLGAWVSSDLEQFGRDLQASGQAQAERNSRELEAAATNAANAFTGALTGGAGSAVAAGEGTASQFLQGARQRFEQSQAPEFKVTTNLETTGERLTAFIDNVGEGANKFYLDSVKTLEVFKQQAAAGQLTADQIEVMNGFAKQLNGKLDAEIAKRQEAAEAAAKQAEEVDKITKATLEQIRTDSEFGGDSGRFKAAQNLLLVQQEIVRVEEQLRAARESSDQAAISTLTSRLSTLDQVASKERDIASGAEKARKDAIKEADRIDKEIAKNQEKIRDTQFKQALERAEQLAKTEGSAVKISDIRDGGITAFFDALKEDPSLKEAKKQSQELASIRKEIAKLTAEKVDILAGTG